MEAENNDEKYRSKYAMYFDPNSNPIILYDTHIDRIDIHGDLYTQLHEGVNKVLAARKPQIIRKNDGVAKDDGVAEKSQKTQDKSQDHDESQEHDESKEHDERHKQSPLVSALQVFAKEIPYSRRYKWGYGYQALVRKKLIPDSMSNIEFAKTVERITGISTSTVRRMGQFFVNCPEHQQEVDELVAMI